ncbi:apoptotic chromatin condensation inducer in the nucleus [Topomyia yanbarensis]|uniref:apoptotic chromatin condensation inducer in the nucleus n=1 Tax=Topomyia yanbarensis TaxID=2498891 RepID=UPI00273AD409|nr:apoptotic chromatin condensation inducer in the nucleus [Topomyia yanbarensis]XP_058825673.1 apoptotic chromatin condensation inducer in the nucleus [Topomyia yanbarensis]
MCICLDVIATPRKAVFRKGKSNILVNNRRMRRKTAAKTSPDKTSRRTSRRGRKSPSVNSDREEDHDKELEAEAAEQAESDESGSEQEETQRKGKVRRNTRAKSSEERSLVKPRRNPRRKSQSVEPSDQDESEKEENGEQGKIIETDVMETIPEEKPEEIPETSEVSEYKENVHVEIDALLEPEPEENNAQVEVTESSSEQHNGDNAEPDQSEPVENVRTDVCEQSRESGEVDSESVQEEESQHMSLKQEEITKEASPVKEVSEDDSSSQESPPQIPPPKPARKSRFSSRSKSPEIINTIVQMPAKQDDDKNDEELEAGEIKDDPVLVRSPEKKLTDDKPVRKPLQRKRRWLSSKTDAKSSVITISTDSLKNIISEPVQPVPLADIKLESSPEPEEIVDSNEDQPTAERRHSRDKLSSKPPEKENIEQDVEVEHKPKLADKNIITRKISMVSDKGNNLVTRPPSPARHHSSNILYITNLVRPFTVLQLKGLLARTGKIVENGFWIDKIKSKCFVKYETEDEAVETRHALHGVRWPTSNPKCLNVDFGTESAMEKAIISTLDDAGTTRITIDNSKEAREFGWSRDSMKQNEDLHVTRPVREWDLGKKDTFDHDRIEGDRSGRDKDRDRDRERDRDRDLDRERDRSGRNEGRGDRSAPGGRRRSTERDYGRDRNRDRRRNSTSLSPARKFKKKENEPPIRLLDDLFRKTKTIPCIYWLPLTAEQIAVKEEQRRKNLIETQRRQEEARKQEEERRKERERRDRERRERIRSNSRDRRRRSRTRDDARRRHR